MGQTEETHEKRESSFFNQRDTEKKRAKCAIAHYVVHKLLRKGDSILLDAGTSLYPVANWIVQEAVKASREQDPNERKFKHYTIMTHNYQAFRILVDSIPREANFNIVLAGGRYDQDLNALFGPQTIMSYENFFPRVVLIGASGIVADQGLFCHGNTEEPAVKDVIFKKSAMRRILITDYEKLGRPDALRFGESQDLREGVESCLLVTDQPAVENEGNVGNGEIPGPTLRDRFRREVEILQNTYNVEVHIVDDEYIQDYGDYPSKE